MKHRMREWYYQRRFLTAYRILRNTKERHVAAGHEVRFRVVHDAHICLECVDCPDFSDE